MHFLRPRVAKAPCIFESQLIILIQQSRQHSFILLIFLHFLCFFAHVAFIFGYLVFFFLLYFSKGASFKKGIPTGKIGLIKSIYKNDRRFIEEIRKFSLVVFYESPLITYMHTRLNIILSYLFQALDFLYVKLFLVHKRRKRKRLISQFLQSRDRGFN